MADRETTDVRELGRWIRRSNAEVGAIAAAAAIPHKFVVAVLNQLHAAGITAVDFTGLGMPSAAISRMPFLLYPGMEPPDEWVKEEPREAQGKETDDP